MFRPGILFFTCFFLTAVAFAQHDANRMFKVYSVKDGLVSNSVHAMARSKKGFWWIGTPVGFQRFDGYSFVSIDEPFDDKSKPVTGSKSIYEDSVGNAWVFNLSGSYKVDGTTLKATWVQVDTSKVVFMPSAYHYPVTESATHLWCIQYNTGFYGINKKTCVIDTSIVLDNRTLPLLSFVTVYPSIGKDDEGFSWIALSSERGDSNFIFRYKPGNMPERYSFAAGGYGVLKAYIPVGNNEFLFISTAYTALCRGSDYANPLKILSRENIPGSYYRNFNFEKLKVYHKGNIIFPGNEVIYEYNPTAKTLQPYTTAPYQNLNLSRRFVYTLKEDENGNIWIGRDASEGLMVYYPAKEQFGLMQAPAENFSLVYCLATDNNGNVYAGNYQKGINVFDKEGLFKKYVPLPYAEHGMELSIRTMQLMDDGNILMMSVYGRVFELNTRSLTVKEITRNFPEGYSKVPEVYDGGFLRTGTNSYDFMYRRSIYNIQKKGESYTILKKDTVPADVAFGVIYYHTDGLKYAGGYKGLFVNRNSQWSEVKMPSVYVKHITADRSGNIWVSTEKGIYVLRNGQVLHSYTTADGLLNDYVYGILFDQAGNAWYSSNRGLGSIRQNGTKVFFTADDGLQDDEFDTQSFCIGPEGKFYFGGIKGITSFYPAAINLAVQPGEVRLSELRVNDRIISYDMRNSLELGYQENDIQFSFALTNMNNPENNVFKIKLDGLDNDWVEIKNIHSYRYRLAYGNYVLRIKGSTNNFNWSKEFILPLTIHAPWWRTWWFAGLLLAVVVASTIVIIRLFDYYKKKKAARLEEIKNSLQQERERISRDLHDHLGSNLVTIIAQVDNIEAKLHKKTIDDASHTLQQLSSQTRETMNALRETIWAVQETEHTLNDFVIRIRTFLQRVYEPVNISWKVTAKTNDVVTLSPAQTLHLFRIVQEATQNILKHALAKEVSYEFIQDDKELQLIISDDGRGFVSASTNNAGHGLLNIKDRVKEMKGTMDVNSLRGEGTVINISIPL